MSDLFAYVGRQAILTPELNVVALLYRDSMENRAMLDQPLVELVRQLR